MSHLAHVYRATVILRRRRAMNLRTCARRIGVSLTMGAASLTVLALTATSANAAALFNGCSFGSTPERAIEKAIA